MAFGGLLTVLDDIASTLDDVAAMSKIAAGKTASISGDDLAVNSAVVTGFDPKRELSIVWQIAKGSLKNKAILIPAALTLGVAAPWAIAPILMLGGAYFCYEGVEKIIHRHSHKEHHDLMVNADKDPKALEKFEKEKIRGAVRTDFILSAEIVAITLATVAASPFVTQLLVLGAIGVGTTMGIYGLVGGIVKLDDIGLHLAEKKGKSALAKAQRTAGDALVKASPKIMKGLAVVGTAAMLVVGGGLILHGLPFAHHAIESLMHVIPASGIAQGAAGIAVELAVGVASGFAAIGVTKLAAPIYKPCKKFLGKLKTRLFKKKSEESTAVRSAPESSAAPLQKAEEKDVAAALNDAAAKKEIPEARSPQPESRKKGPKPPI